MAPEVWLLAGVWEWAYLAAAGEARREKRLHGGFHHVRNGHVARRGAQLPPLPVTGDAARR